MPAMALLDTDGVYGAPRFHLAANKAKIKAHIGAEVALSPRFPITVPDRQSMNHIEHQSKVATNSFRLPLLVASRAGYQNLCRLITKMKLRAKKGEGAVTEEELQEHAHGLICLTGGAEGPLAAALQQGGVDEARRCVDQLVEFSARKMFTLNYSGIFSAKKSPAIALRSTIALFAESSAAGHQRRLLRHSAGAATLRCLHRHPQPSHAVDRRPIAYAQCRTLPEISTRRCSNFSPTIPKPSPTRANFPLAWNSRSTIWATNFRAIPCPRARPSNSIFFCASGRGEDFARATDARRATCRPKRASQIEKELALIEKLSLAGYFLIVWDLVRYCREQNILVQGRGSAANSAVCYSLGITAVDAVGMELLFERFLSEERGEWPDIDLDLPSGDEREKVIQYVYRRYGARGAAMTANVITYRNRMAAPPTGKALGFDAETLQKISAAVATWEFRDENDALHRRFRDAGLDLNHPRLRKYYELCIAVQDMPRHLGQHSGGMVICQGQLDSVVPLEPASMPGRVVVQWDKEDCADMGIVKVDLARPRLRWPPELIRDHYHEEVELAHLPQDDPQVYSALQEADTVGLFQVESRAQMASLPRLRPMRFYDVVVQVAIIRPGPIVGQMVNPFILRRQGREDVTYPHPSLEPVLKRTLGVPLFQEQLLRLAMIAANFTGGEAEELRRAMGFKRSQARMREIETKLRSGMTHNGISPKAQEEIILSITSFALYGFPESHAASFALIAYASAYLKAHYLAAFTAALLNNQPMGFYSPATIVKDAQRHGLKLLPVDVTRSEWNCTLEPVRESPSTQYPVKNPSLDSALI